MACIRMSVRPAAPFPARLRSTSSSSDLRHAELVPDLGRLGEKPCCSLVIARSPANLQHARVVTLRVGNPRPRPHPIVQLERVVEVTASLVPALADRGEDPEVAR